MLHILNGVCHLAFEIVKNVLSKTLVGGIVFSFLGLTIFALFLSPILFVNSADANHRTTPTVHYHGTTPVS